MNRRLTFRGFCPALMVVLLGCGTWIKNPDSGPAPKGDGQVSVRVETSQSENANSPGSALSPVAVLDKNGQNMGGLVFSQAFMLIKEVKLRPLTAGMPEARLTGPSIVNLLTQEISPTLTGTVPANQYQDVNVHIERLAAPQQAPLGAPAEQVGYSVYVNGTWTNAQNVEKPLTLKIDLTGEFPIAQMTGGITVDSEHPLALDFDLNINQWFDFSGATMDLTTVTKASIDLNATQTGAEKTLYDTVLKNFKASISLKAGKAPPAPK